MCRKRESAGLAAVLLLASGLCLAADPPAATPPVAQKAAETVLRMDAPRIEVAFVLDTTGSMAGLIQGAKDTIWAIANQVAQSKPAPEIRMGLVGYRDRGDAYITRTTTLTDDIDKVYADLMAFAAEGGGDTEESVNQAIHEAVTKLDWSSDPKAFRVIFLVGDAPPHMDYQDDVKYAESCRLAAEKDIVLNTLQCGNIDGTAAIWQEIATRAEGKYFAIPQTGGVETVSTPYDADLARLSNEMDGTVLYFGDAVVQSEMRHRKMASLDLMASSSAPAAAERATYQASEAGAANFLGRQELVDEISSGNVKLEDLPKDQLPEELKSLTPEEQKGVVEKKKEEREKLRAEIQKLSEERAKFLRAEQEKRAKEGTSSFDKAVFDALAEQGARKGIVYTSAP